MGIYTLQTQTKYVDQRVQLARPRVLRKLQLCERFQVSRRECKSLLSGLNLGDQHMNSDPEDSTCINHKVDGCTEGRMVDTVRNEDGVSDCHQAPSHGNKRKLEKSFIRSPSAPLRMN